MATPRREMKKSRERQARAARLAAQRRQRTIKTFSMFGVIAIVLALVAGSFQVFGSDSSDEATDSTTSTTTSTSTTLVPAAAATARAITGDTPCPAADGSTEVAGSFEKAPTMCIDPAKKYTATFDTNQGVVVVDLDTAKTPNTVNNFVTLSRYHYYDGSQIFRTDPRIDIIQGGGPHSESASDSGPGYTIKDEGNGFKYTEGDLVMARTEGPDSAGAQYFFATGPKVATLDGQGTYVTFGHASQGLDVLKKIIGMHQATTDGLGGKPSSPVVVNKITITEA